MRKKTGLFLLSFLICACLFAGCGSGFSDEVIARIDDREIMKSEYMVYLYTTTQSFVSTAGNDVWEMDFDGQTGEELVQERALSTMQSVIAAESFAAENNISLTEEQIQEAHTAAEDFWNNLTEEDREKMGIDEKSLDSLMEESYLYSVVSEKLAAECAVSEEETQSYYEENKGEIQDAYTLYTVDSIMVQDEETAKEVAQKAQSGEDFSELFAAYDVDETAKESEEGGQMTLYKSYMNNTFGIEEDLGLGQITDPLEVSGSYFILKVEEISVPTEADVKTLAEETYRSQVQQAYVENRMSEMTKNQKVEKVAEVWENMDTFHQ
ncbi:peptidyl-prolyl cis-trans isomerase [Anaerotignum lactatifermentans]|uniref:Peptidyl-prolyl cis-trans isomerase n=1 Tax=Anaerotignum lactatifermentans TaxID=160404 RepID=A0ABS2GBL1_9FIRM|nr:peptidyl-prolyl cis-trans isomerase [Anaerotignum lactatifermentans]MBM6828654.1 peptidyl-prolyl cis-trans isomerase [Anaerotignum lactatifermentans]MBM6878572.1 peptidyl-prolyl cis-trans isomerase [Anaerotignum lactatifermentans]MBM6950236.1 peptidyl-prolyl cis-trans isomerase [Anaerotignum lactatifermentans]